MLFNYLVTWGAAAEPIAGYVSLPVLLLNSITGNVVDYYVLIELQATRVVVKSLSGLGDSSGT